MQCLQHTVAARLIRLQSTRDRDMCMLVASTPYKACALSKVALLSSCGAPPVLGATIEPKMESSVLSSASKHDET